MLGTISAYFEHFTYGNQQRLSVSSGQAFSTTFEAVTDVEVAKRLNYVVSSELVIAYEIGALSSKMCDLRPFVGNGILAIMGIPVDKTVHATLAGIETIHLPTAQRKSSYKAIIVYLGAGCADVPIDFYCDAGPRIRHQCT